MSNRQWAVLNAGKAIPPPLVPEEVADTLYLLDRLTEATGGRTRSPESIAEYLEQLTPL